MYVLLALAHAALQATLGKEAVKLSNTHIPMAMSILLKPMRRRSNVQWPSVQRAMRRRSNVQLPSVQSATCKQCKTSAKGPA